MIRKILRKIILWAIRDDVEISINAAVRENNARMPALMRDAQQRFL